MLQGSRWRGWRSVVTLLTVSGLVFATPAPVPHAQEAVPHQEQTPAAPGEGESAPIEEPAPPAQDAAPAAGEGTLPEGLSPEARISDPIVLNDPVVLNATGDLHVAMRVEADGTATFDAAPGPGNDTGPTNGVVRVNDTVTYYVTYQSGSQPAPNTTLDITFPKGMAITDLPGFCGPGSSITPPTAGIPALPLDNNSWQELAEQTVHCVLGDVPADATENVRFSAKVLNYVHDAQTLTVPALSIAATGRNTFNAEPATLPSVAASARLMWDISKNGVSEVKNEGYVGGPTQGACPWQPTRICMRLDHSVLISGPAGGKGAMPAIGDIRVTDNLSPRSYFPGLTEEQYRQIEADLDRYGARLQADTTNYFEIPGSSIGGTNTAADSVRNSGVLRWSPTPMSQGGVVHEGVISGADMSLLTYPTRVQQPSGKALPVDKAYAVSHTFSVWVPTETVTTFGTGPVSSKTLQVTNAFTDLKIDGFNGATQSLAEQPTENDSTTRPLRVDFVGDMSKNFVGVPGEPRNMTNREFSPNWQARGEGPPGGNIFGSGNIQVAPKQNIQSQLFFKGSTPAVNAPITYLACDSWDNQRLYLRAASTPGSAQRSTFQDVPSGGAPVWISGYNNVLRGTSAVWANDASQVPELKVQYAAGPGGPQAQSECGSGAGPWFDDPSQVPGNDPALLGEGLYTGVGRVRVLLTLPGPVTLSRSEVWATVAINQQVAEWPGQVSGDLIPNYASVKMMPFATVSSFAEADAHVSPWRQSQYDVSRHAGGQGDRLRLVTALARINKTVRKEGVGEFSDVAPSLTGGEVLEFRLQPSLITGATTVGSRKEMWIEECLPNAAMYLSANIPPTVVSATAPADAKTTCPAGTTYLRWVFPEAEVNATQPEVIYRAEVLASARDGSYNENATVWAEGDTSALNLRQNNAPFRVSNRVGVYLQKMAITPLVQVNPTGNTNHELNRWRVRLSNTTPAEGTVSPENIDIIDLLPRVGFPAGGAETSRFSGTFVLDSVVVDTAVSNTPTQTTRVLYTAATNPHHDPNDPSNLAGGSTAWCDAPAGGTLVRGTGACPANSNEVTAVRVLREGPFQQGQAIQFDVALRAEGNAHDDLYVNRTAARADRVDFLVGPIDRSERAIGATIGDKVWLDANKDGIQDASEKPAVGVKVTLTGTDDLGNQVNIETRTDSSGNYLFAGLRASNGDGYTVTFSDIPPGTQFTTQTAGGDPAADSNVNAQGVSAAVVLTAGETNLTVDAGLVTSHFPIHVRKIENSGGSTGNQVVTLNYECTAEGVKGAAVMAARGTVEVVPGADEATATPTEIALFPEGTSCRITGEDDQERAGWTLDTDFGQAAVAGPNSAAAPIQVTNTYTRKMGTIRVAKVFEGLGAYTSRLAGRDILVNYTCNPGNGAAALTGTIALKEADGFAGISPEIPVGSDCTLTEDTATAQVSGFELTGTTYSTPGGVVTVADTPGAPTELTVTNTYAQQFGSVEITKQVLIDGVVDPQNNQLYELRWTCTDGVNHRITDAYTLVGHGAKHRIENLPVGTTCTFTEEDPRVDLHSWAHDFSPSNVVTVGSTDLVALTLTNSLTRNRGSLVVSKVVSGAAAGAVPADYEFRYSLVCQDFNSNFTVALPEITVRRGQQTVVDNVPAGLCRLTELNPEIAGTNVEVWRYHAYENRMDGSMAEINVKAGQPYTITWENIYTPQMANFSVAKTASAPGYPNAIPVNKEYSFSYTCTPAYSGAPTVANEVISGVTTAQGWISPDLPIGTECVVTELTDSATLNGFSLRAPAPQTVVVGDPATRRLTFHNEYIREVGKLAIAKTVTGEAQSLAPVTFTFNYICYEGNTTAVSRSGTISLLASQSETISDIPTGHCVVTENPAPATNTTLETTVTVDGIPQTTGTRVEVIIGGPGQPTPWVEYTNKYTPVTVPFIVRKVVAADGYEQLFADKEYSFTYTCTEAYQGAGVAEGTITGVTVNAPGRGPELPIGTECDITEVPASAEQAGFTWTLEGGNAPRRVTITDGPDVPEAAFTNRYERHRGSFKVTKAVTGTAAGKVTEQQPPVEFTFRYTCTDLAGMPAVTGELTLGTDAEATIDNIPEGQCEILEVNAPDIEHTTVTTKAAVDDQAPVDGNRAVVQVVAGAPVVATAAFENIYTAQLTPFTVAKTVTADHQAGLLAGKEFAFDYTCTPAFPGAFADGGAIEGVTTTSPGLSRPLPIGTECEVTERVDTAQHEGFSVAVPAPQRVTVGADNTPVALTFTNTYSRERGSFAISSNVIVDGQPNPDPTSIFPVQYRCTDGVTEVTGTVDVPGDGREVIVENILLGSTCTVEEADVNRPGYTLAKRIDPSQFQITNATDRPQITVTNTYTRDLGGFSLTKEIAGNAAVKVAADQQFEFTYTCRGEDGSTIGPEKLLLTAGATMQVADVPTGGCEITETAYAPEHTTSVTTPAVDGQEQDAGLVATFKVTKDVADTAQVKFTNTYTADTAVFTVAKTVTADSMVSVLAGKTFAFGYTCTPAYRGAFVPADGAITGVTVDNPGTSMELPIGTECQVTERPAAHPGFTWAAPQPQTVTVAAGPEPVGVTMANTYTRERGSFTVSKQVAGGAASLAPQEFRFSYVCTDLDGTQSAAKEITVPTGQSVTVDAIPTGDCQITEQNTPVSNTALATTWSVDGGDNQDGATATVTVEAGDTTPVAAAFTNTYEHTGANVTLAKKVALWTAFAGSEYTFQYLCTTAQNERIEGSVTVKGDGTPVQIEQVFPVGTTCEVAEDPDTAQRAGFLLLPPRAFAFTVREADAGQTLAFEATNTYIPWLGFLIPLIPLVVSAIPQATNPPVAVNPGQAQPSVVTDSQIDKPAKGVVAKAQQAVKKLAQTGVADSLPLLALLGLLLAMVGGALTLRKKSKRN